MTVRAPVRDQGIYQKYKDNDKLPQEQADKRFTRCFSWFADEAFPLPFVLDWYKSSTREYLADPRDIIFITHIVFSFLVVIPSTILLLVRFSWLHAAIHAVMMTQTIPPFILMLHCVCHKKAGTKKGWWIDFTIHNILCPVYGETWNTFYYHHVKHHHIEDNGIEDLSATIWYDRDNWLHFAAYFFRFYFFIALELPIYFIKKGKLEWALKTFVGEVSTLVFYSSFFYVCDPRSVIFAWFVPLNMARIGMMSGNWTQHAFLDPDHATNDYKTALTVIDTYYNKTCFNDGYHTSHHLNPIRHWQDHPEHFLASREKFNEQKVIIFRNCDYWEIWCHLMVKDHVWLAKHLVSNDSDSVEAKVAFLKTRLKRLSPQQMKNSFAKKSL